MQNLRSVRCSLQFSISSFKTAFFFSALNNSDVWCDGILVFYEIFKFLEENVSAQILPIEIRRTEQFEADLTYFKGRDWKKTYKIRAPVQSYLDHLNAINEKNPLLLVS